MKNDLRLLPDENNIHYFRVIGEDRKIHVSNLQSEFCKCGVRIIRKYVTEKDYSILFSCYDCCEGTY